MSKGKMMYGVMLDVDLKEIAAAKAKKNGISLAKVVRDYLGWWVNIDDPSPVVIDRREFEKYELKKG